MRLLEETLQKLKILKDLNFNTVDDLRNTYFINLNNKVEKENILALLDNNIWSFKQIVDKFKEIKDENNDSCLYYLLKSEELFKELIDEKLLNIDDLRYLLNEIDKSIELDWLFDDNISLSKHILKEFVLDKELVDKFNEMLESRTIFEYIEHHTTYTYDDNDLKDEEEIDKELLKLNELNKQLYSFNFDNKQKLELAVLIDSEIAQNTLKQIVDNNLEDQYDFDALKNLLTKDNDKTLKTKFNF